MPDMTLIPVSGQMIIKDLVGFQLMDMIWNRRFRFSGEDVGTFVVWDAVYNILFRDWISANIFTGQYELDANEPMEKALQRLIFVYEPYALIQQSLMRKKSWTYMKATQYGLGSALIQVLITDMVVDKIIIRTGEIANNPK